MTERVGPFRGINNRLPDHKLAVFERGEKAGDHLRVARNVDLSDAGTVKRRDGVTLEVPGVNCHSLHAAGGTAYYVDNGTLYQFPRTQIRQDLGVNSQVAFCEIPAMGVVWSNGVVIEKITGSSSVSLGVPMPTPVAITVSGGGGLPAGLYLVSVAGIDPAGMESPATHPVQLDVPDGGAITVDAPGMKAIYVSAQNGDVLFRAATTPDRPVTIAVMPEQRAQCQTLGLVAMPPGNLLAWYNGRLLVASGSYLLYSEVYAPSLHNPARGYIPFDAGITMVAPCLDGVYVGTRDSTYWLAGPDIEAAQLVRVLPYGAAFGSCAARPERNEVWWYSARGMVVGTPGGNVKNIQEENISVPEATRAATLFQERDGTQRFIASTDNGATSVAAASSYMAMEIIR